jgi:hypothetical protein
VREGGEGGKGGRRTWKGRERLAVKVDEGPLYLSPPSLPPSLLTVNIRLCHTLEHVGAPFQASDTQVLRLLHLGRKERREGGREGGRERGSVSYSASTRHTPFYLYLPFLSRLISLSLLSSPTSWPTLVKAVEKRRRNPPNRLPSSAPVAVPGEAGAGGTAPK